MKERTLTIECADCKNIYGLWRTQCPACGTNNPKYRDYHEPERAPRAPKIKIPVERRRPRNECIACHGGGAKVRCPHCNELAHKACITLHAPECAAFQVTLQEAYKKEGLTS